MSEEQPRLHPIHKRIITYVTVSIGMTLGYFYLINLQWQGEKALHTLMESMAFLLAFTVGVLALIRFYSQKENTILFIGVGFLGTAFLDGYHAVVTSVWFDQLWPSTPAHLIPWSWNASRTFLSILIFISWLAWLREEKLGKKGRIPENFIYAAVAILTVLTFVFFAFAPLPRAYYPEYYWGRPEEFISAFFFAIALYGYLKKGKWKISSFEHWIVIFLIISVIGQAFFMSRSFFLFDTMFDVAHSLKNISYLVVLIGLLINISRLFKTSVENERTLQLANDELEQFAYVASHDLKAPLRGIASITDWVLEDYSDKLDAEGKENLGLLKNRVTRMQSLIDGILAYSHITRTKEKEEWLSLKTVLQDVIESLEIPGQINVDVPKKMPSVWYTKIQLTQIFQNIVSNSIKYNDKAEGKISVIFKERADDIVVGVSDNGPGIAKENMKKVFEIFQTLNLRGKDKSTGVGLSIVDKIIAKHGGQIWIESKVGEGATFYFTILKSGGQREE